MAADDEVAPSGSGGAHPGISNLWADDAGAMSSVIGHLYELGHRRIVHIAGLPDLAHTRRRIGSLRDEAARRGLTDARSLTTDYSDTEGADATRRVLAEERPPTAIVYDNDVMAVAGLAVAAERGVSVPAQLSIVAWDDSVLCRSTHPDLTALSRDTPAFGRHAAEQLIALLDGGPAARVQDELPRLVTRGSTGAPPSAV
jgi:DNA-binding LacI/PurR family transcriptional regulator